MTKAEEVARKIIKKSRATSLNAHGKKYEPIKTLIRNLKKNIEQAIIKTEQDAIEKCARIADDAFRPHTFASENSDTYIKQWYIGKQIGKKIREEKQWTNYGC